MKKILSICTLFLAILITTYFLYQQSLVQSSYNGLPTVPCLDYTQLIVQEFSFSVTITIRGKNYPLSPTIGHDAGECLHDIFTNDTSGIVFVKSNDVEKFTLGQFFDVWHKTFTEKQLFNLQTSTAHKIFIFVNGTPIEEYRNIVLTPNQKIIITYN